jgi:hypothetical protein
MPAQFPGALNRYATSEPLGLVRMKTAQQICGQTERPKPFKLGDLGQQAFQPDPAGTGRQPGTVRVELRTDGNKTGTPGSVLADPDRRRMGQLAAGAR